MKKVFIGIDFSKLKFDAAIYSIDTKAIVSTEVFENEQSGFSEFLQWVRENTLLPRDFIAWENGNCNLDMPHDGIVRQRRATCGTCFNKFR